MNKKLIGFSAIVIIIGIIIMAVKGFNVSLKYKEHKVVQISLGQEFDTKDVDKIAEDVLGKGKVFVEKAGLYNDVIRINAEEITDEQANEIAKKINEKYNVSQELIVPVVEGFEVADVEAIAKEVLGKESVKVEKYEENESYATIEAGIITDKEAEELANKINEKYEVSITKSSIQYDKEISLSKVGRVTLMDMAKQYLFYVIIATFAVLVYFAIMYRKQGIANVVSKTVVLIVLAEALFVSIIAIVRYPIDKLVIMAALTIYIAVITYLNKLFIDNKQKESK